ncbi:MAG: hypothetical protein ACKO9V_02295 [Candidatus Kapaibacterium sp.]
MDTTPVTGHVIIDTEALASFADRNPFTLTALPSVCEKLGLRLHVLKTGDDGYLAHGHPWNEDTATTTLRRNESCTCSLNGCIRDAVLSRTESEAYIIAVIAAADSICLATYADRIFAAGAARNACEHRQYPHHPVAQWTDVERAITSLKTTEHMTPRRQARLQRMDALKSE